MAIDTSGEFWKGKSTDDLIEYIRILTKEGYPTSKHIVAKCSCGKQHFQLTADQDEGCAKRICASCGIEKFICDSEENWQGSSPKKLKCNCRKDIFEIVVGFSLRDGGEIKWVYIGERCVNCELLGSYVDWGIDYAPTKHLYSMV